MPGAGSTHRMADTHKWVYPFGKDCELPPLSRSLLGGKGYGEVEMTKLGLPVPPGFIITTEACTFFRDNEEKFPDGLEEQVDTCIKIIEKQMGRKFGDLHNPLLVSVRSGARVSMPGMMETVLDLGLNDDSLPGFAKKMGSEVMAYDTYRRFIGLYSNVVEGVDSKHFENILAKMRKKEGVQFDIALSLESFKAVCAEFKKTFEEHTHKTFPTEPRLQLMNSIKAVFKSWDCAKAVAYRRHHNIPDDWGTAVNVMAMVFGNRGTNSATGVGFTRDPATGEHCFYGEYLTNAQGEDVVAGIRTPQPINKFQANLTGSLLPSLEETMPEVYKQLENIAVILESKFQDMQDVEFTIEEGKLYMLQTRTGKRTVFAAIRIAFDMLEEGLIDEKELILRVDPSQLTQLLTPVFEPKAQTMHATSMVARGLNAGPGAACGVAAFTSAEALAFKKKGTPCILVREETSPEDFAGMVASEGILTLRGGSTSHAAVVARGLGKPCVCGCSSLVLSEKEKTLSVRGHNLKEGDYISIDGTRGQVYFCKLETIASEIIQILVDKSKKGSESQLFRNFDSLMRLADKYRRLGVRTNADTPTDAAVALAFGCEGIGLVRTEHMFMAKERLMDVRCMFFADSDEKRRDAVKRLLPYQKEDFLGIFRVMDGLPVTIRLLDPPRHEFMPHSEEDQAALAKYMGVSLKYVKDLADQISEANPMLGHRGCRLGIAYPYLTEMQTRAIIEAAIEVVEEGKRIHPEIMIPLVFTKRELDHQKAIVRETATAVYRERGRMVPYKLGSMIELPRAALVADEIASSADFFSFGTNDLTQCTLGISRDDSGNFLPLYIEGVKIPRMGNQVQIMEFDPFQILDKNGVGELINMACTKGKSVNPALHLGVCGEHGGDAESVKLLEKLGLDYVSCSPYRVPIARLAAAHAKIKLDNQKLAEIEAARNKMLMTS